MKALWLFLLSFAVHADINSDCPQFTFNGKPSYTPINGDQEVCHLNYAVIHRCVTKTPVAVFEHVTVKDITGNSERQNNFHEDKEIAPQCRASVSDYNDHYDKGHMNPAQDNTTNDAIMSESFLMSNMVPQNPNNNRGIWRALETQVRLWVTQGKDLYVITGPVYTAGYQTIGHGVGVPQYLFKVIIDSKSKQSTAYLIPNVALPVESLPKYVTTIEAIEKASGLTFNLN